MLFTQNVPSLISCAYDVNSFVFFCSVLFSFSFGVGALVFLNLTFAGVEGFA